MTNRATSRKHLWVTAHSRGPADSQLHYAASRGRFAFISIEAILNGMTTLAPTRAPSATIAAEANAALVALSPMGRRKKKRAVRVRSEADDGEEVSVLVPAEAFEMFLAVLAQMANGNAVTVVPVHAELTTQEAADMLNVSRPHLVKLLDEQKIPHRMVGTHRRVLVVDLLTFKRDDDAKRKAIADELAAKAEKLGLGH